MNAKPWHYLPKRHTITCPWEATHEIACATADALEAWGLTSPSNPAWRGAREKVGALKPGLLERMHVCLWIRGEVFLGEPPVCVPMSNGRGLVCRVEREELHVRIRTVEQPKPITLEVVAVQVEEASDREGREILSDVENELGLAHGTRVLTVPRPFTGLLHVTVPITGGWGVPSRESSVAP